MIKSKHTIYGDLFKLKEFCKEFLKHPFEKIKNVPAVSWESCVAGIIGINLICGILRAVYQFSAINFLISILITPLIAAFALVLISLLIYYFFQIVFKETYDFEKICAVLFLAYVPAAPFFIGSVIYPPLFVPGLVINSVLLVVGLEENLQVPKRTLIKLVSAGFIFVLIFWIIQQTFAIKTSMDPKSLDQLEEEVETGMGTE